MDSIKLTKLQKKEMKKVFGGQEVTCICSPCASCYCGEGDTIPAQTRNTPPDFVIVSPKNLRQRVWRFSDALPSALFGCKPPCSEEA